jgi:xanthine dehydrogenase accessory factor
MRDILSTLLRWTADGRRAAIATVVRVERSAPRMPGSAMAVSETGDVAGSVTGGCVEPAVYAEAEEVLAGGSPRLLTFGIADEEAFEVGLPCGGRVSVFVELLDPQVVDVVAAAVAAETSVAVATTVDGPNLGELLVVHPEGPGGPVENEARALLARGETGLVRVGEDEVFICSFVPRPNMYVFGAIDHASAVARIGRFLGYRVTVCDARGAFVTPARFPDVDELVVAWPHEFLAQAPIDERTAVCVLTHDQKFDVPALLVALDSPAGYIGAMGSRRTTERRTARLREEGVSEEDLARVHAPIGMRIGSQTPEEVAVAIAAQIISVTRTGDRATGEARARV